MKQKKITIRNKKQIMKTFVLIFFTLCSTSCYPQKVASINLPMSYLFVDEMPKYVGGNKKVKEIIDNNIQWPGAFDGQGTVLTSFIVSKDGNIYDVKIEKGLCDECDLEAIRLVKLLIKWVPGKIGSRNVDVILYLPVKFKISS